MRIQGLQKLTLLDYPGRTACTIFLSGCNFRCPFCHNAPLLTAADEDGMDEDELLAFLKKRQGLLDGVAVTGGEPLLRPDLPQLLEKIKALGYVIKLDTNGAFPERLEAVVCAGLADYVAMDIKNSPARYAETAGTAELDLFAARYRRLRISDDRRRRASRRYLVFEAGRLACRREAVLYPVLPAVRNGLADRTPRPVGRTASSLGGAGAVQDPHSLRSRDMKNNILLSISKINTIYCAKLLTKHKLFG